LKSDTALRASEEEGPGESNWAARGMTVSIDLEVLIKEMMDYNIPSDLQWKEIVRLGKTKCSFPGTSK
jgi:hypothetical protein